MIIYVQLTFLLSKSSGQAPPSPSPQRDVKGLGEFGSLYPTDVASVLFLKQWKLKLKQL
jgi:hypothetical protein